MADLTDPRAVFELGLEAQEYVGETEVLRHWSELAATMLKYHEKLRDLMLVALGDTPTAAQTAVYQRQVRRAEEMTRFLAATGEGFEGSYLGS